MSARLREARFALAVLALAAAGALLAAGHGRDDSATMDEPFHALAAAEYVVSGTCWANLEHPPLAKLLAGVSMALSGVRAPVIPRPFSFAGAEGTHHFVFANDVGPDAVLASARRVFPWLFAFLVVLAAWAARREAGPLAGVAVAAFLAFEPTHVAHAAYLHTDVPASLGLFATILLAVRALEKGSLPLWGAAGAAWGLSMATKFSLVYAGPFLLLVVLVSLFGAAGLVREGGVRALARPALGLALALAVALPVVLLAYVPALRGMTRGEAARSARLFMNARSVPPETAERIEAVSRLLPPAGHFLAGLAGVASQNREGGGVNFLHGRITVDGSWDYFPVAFGVKSSLGLLGLLLAGGVSALVLVRTGRGAGPLATAGFVVAFALFVAAGGASYNIGVRHVLPAVSLLVVASVVSVERLLRPRPAALVAVLVPLALLQAGETAAVHPHEISFFNALAGGPSNGERWLNDSNLDWGQDLKRLASFVGERGIRARDVTVAYFGGDSPPDRIPGSRLYDPLSTPADPGLYAVSSFLLRCGPEFLAVKGNGAAAEGYGRLRRALVERGERVGSVGYSIGVYRIREEGFPAR